MTPASQRTRKTDQGGDVGLTPASQLDPDLQPSQDDTGKITRKWETKAIPPRTLFHQSGWQRNRRPPIHCSPKRDGSGTGRPSARCSPERDGSGRGKRSPSVRCTPNRDVGGRATGAAEVQYCRRGRVSRIRRPLSGITMGIHPIDEGHIRTTSPPGAE